MHPRNRPSAILRLSRDRGYLRRVDSAARAARQVRQAIAREALRQLRHAA